jgi:hypothetical protein
MSNYLGPVSVPQDVITQSAYQLINDVASGSDGSSVLTSLDAQTKASVCQRAMDLLALPPCSMMASGTTFSAAKGNCVDDSANPAAYQHVYTQLYPGVIAACKAAGVTVQEELPLAVGEVGVGFLLGAVAGGLLGHHYGHAVLGVLGGAFAGMMGGFLVYDVQVSRVAAPVAAPTPAAAGWY